MELSFADVLSREKEVCPCLTDSIDTEWNNLMANVPPGLRVRPLRQYDFQAQNGDLEDNDTQGGFSGIQSICHER